MESLKELYKIGYGPSSSHTMGPQRASKIFISNNKDAIKYECYLYDSLAATGKGHLTDYIINREFENSNKEITIFFDEDTKFDKHPNSMLFKAIYENHVEEQLFFSVGGGKIVSEDDTIKVDEVYEHTTMDDILYYCSINKLSLVDYVYLQEDVKDFLVTVKNEMLNSMSLGLSAGGFIPGKLYIKRRAKSFYEQYIEDPNKDITALLYASALAVSEQNASGNIVVTAPTCGASGVIPACLHVMRVHYNKSDDELVDSLAVAGLIGNLAKKNASISGAEVGCQGEVGVACAMAAAAICFLLGGDNNKIEYAAEIAMEHCLGMTCDPVFGYVQIPCIERNAMAAKKAFDAAKFSMLTDGSHLVSLDVCFKTMYKTGIDMKREYRETALGGLAKYIEENYNKD